MWIFLVPFRMAFPGVALVALLLTGCGSDGSGEDGLFPNSLVPGTGPGIRYEVTLTGLDPDSAPADLIRRAARTYTLIDRPPPSLARLARRAEGDLPTLRQVLISEGYYLAGADASLEAPDGEPAQVTFSLAPGPRFTLARFAVATPDGTIVTSRSSAEPALTTGADGTATFEAAGPDENQPVRPPASLLPEPGSPARGADIVAAEERVVAWYREHGHPYAARLDRTARAAVEAETLDVTSRIEPGPALRYGPTRLAGLERVEEAYVRSFVTWEPEATVAQGDLDAVQNELSATGLFEGVRVSLPESAPAAEGDQPVAAPVTIEVEEDKPRSIGGGVRYSTADGPGARLFWEHRNLFGRAERLRTTADVGLVGRSLDVAFVIPRFQTPERSLNAELELTQSDDEVAEETSAVASLGLQETLTPHWRAGLGVSLEAAELTDSDGVRRSYLVGLPGFAQYDTTDDLLDPQQGARLRLTAAPALGRYDDQPTSFLSLDANASRYLALTQSGDLVLATRARLGSILGQEHDRVPVNRRLFSGGGGSVRGYDTRFIGPLDEDGDPVGGLSVLETGLELRVRLSETVGLVPFLEAGSVSESPVPDLADGIQVGAGLGLRYYSVAGPVRLDLAVPLNPRDEDDSFQFYVSIGQAF